MTQNIYAERNLHSIYAIPFDQLPQGPMRLELERRAKRGDLICARTAPFEEHYWIWERPTTDTGSDQAFTIAEWSAKTGYPLEWGGAYGYGLHDPNEVRDEVPDAEDEDEDDYDDWDEGFYHDLDDEDDEDTDA